MRIASLFVVASTIAAAHVAVASGGPLAADPGGASASFTVPQGALLVVDLAEGRLAPRVLDDAEPVPLGHPGLLTHDCRNDVAASSASSPTSFPVRGNVLAPARENLASQGACDGDEIHHSTPALLRFRTYGDGGGYVVLQGWRDDPAQGTLEGIYVVDCRPAGASTAGGAGSEWHYEGSVARSDCRHSHEGSLQPGEFERWSARVYNRNVLIGSTYAALN